jgi:hypothetical protein
MSKIKNILLVFSIYTLLNSESTNKKKDINNNKTKHIKKITTTFNEKTINQINQHLNKPTREERQRTLPHLNKPTREERPIKQEEEQIEMDPELVDAINLHNIKYKETSCKKEE